jgi:GTPase SAR1 family protein/HAMP domain-containing protein
MNITPQSEQMKKQRQRLITLCQQAQNQLAELALPELAEESKTFVSLAERLQSSTFKILILGEQNRGKSTLINALLKTEVFPISNTSLICEIKYDKREHGVLHWRSGRRDEMPLQKLKGYIEKKDTTDFASVYDYPYSRAEVFYPFALGEDHIELVDSPGLNDIDHLEDMVNDYYPFVTLAIFLLDCSHPLTASELNEIDFYRKHFQNNLFFVCNKLDLLLEGDRKIVQQDFINRLRNITPHGERYIFFLSAKAALKERMEKGKKPRSRIGNLSGRTDSLELLEQSIREFVSSQTDQLQTAMPATMLRNALQRAWQTIANTRQTIANYSDLLRRPDLTGEQVSQRFADPALQEQLDELEKLSAQIARGMVSFRAGTKIFAQQEIAQLYSNFALQIPSWIKDYNEKNTVGIIHQLSSKAHSKLAEELRSFLSQKLQEEAQSWQDNHFRVALQGLLTPFFDALGDSLHRFELDLATIQRNVFAGPNFSSGEDDNESLADLFQQIFSQPDLSFKFNSPGPKNMIILAIAASIVTGAIVADVAWFITIPAMLLIGIGGGWSAMNVNETIKKIVGGTFSNELLEKKDSIVARAVAKIDKLLFRLEQQIGLELGFKIRHLRERVETFIYDKERGEKEIQDELERFQRVSDQLAALEQEIDEILHDIGAVQTDA